MSDCVVLVVAGSNRAVLRWITALLVLMLHR